MISVKEDSINQMDLKNGWTDGMEGMDRMEWNGWNGMESDRIELTILICCDQPEAANSKIRRGSRNPRAAWCHAVLTQLRDLL